MSKLLTGTVYYYYFPTPKDPSIFGLHTQRRCQNVRPGPNYVAFIGIYVLLHGLRSYNVFVAKSSLCPQRELSHNASTH